jgi:hypothetical protein
VDFYGDVLVELMTAMGAALFVGNGLALFKRRSDRRAAARESAARARPGSPVRQQVRVATSGRLDQAPIGRSIGFMALGFVVFIWGLATITT